MADNPWSSGHDASLKRRRPVQSWLVISIPDPRRNYFATLQRDSKASMSLADKLPPLADNCPECRVDCLLGEQDKTIKKGCGFQTPNIGTVWAQTLDKEVLMTQLAQLPHVGIIHTKNGKFLVRCLLEQVSAVRQAIAKEDHRYAAMPNLVVTRKWKISNPVQQGHILDLDAPPDEPPPQFQLLVQDHICIVSEVGARQVQPSATIQVTTPTPGAKPAPVQGPDVIAQVKEGMRQTERLLTDHIDSRLSAKVVEMVDSKLQQVQHLQEKVSQMDATIQALHASSSSSSTRIQAIEVATSQTFSRLEAFVEQGQYRNTGRDHQAHFCPERLCHPATIPVGSHRCQPGRKDGENGRYVDVQDGYSEEVTGGR
eukprot:1809863-Amphidinium_carterae.1